jgi:hypothetical protein
MNFQVAASSRLFLWHKRIVNNIEKLRSGLWPEASAEPVCRASCAHGSQLPLSSFSNAASGKMETPRINASANKIPLQKAKGKCGFVVTSSRIIGSIHLMGFLPVIRTFPK